MKAIVVEGPMGVGKSKVAFALARALNSVILTADAPQLYSKFNLAANKPTIQMQKTIPYPLLSKYDPKCYSYTKPLTLWQYRADAMSVLQACWAKNQIPVLEGGSPLYLKCLIYGKEKAESFDIPSDLRAKAKSIISVHHGDWDASVAYVKSEVPGVEVTCTHNDYYRLEKAALLALSGKQPTRDMFSLTPLFDARVFYLDLDNGSIMRTIDYRCERAVESGLVEEVINLILSGDFNCKEALDKLPEHSKGYAETFEYIQRMLRKVKEGKLIDEELVVMFYGYIANMITNTKKGIKEQRKTFKNSAADAVPIQMSLDSYGQLPLAAVVPQILNWVNLPREEFEARKGAPASFFKLNLSVDSRITWTVYPQKSATPAAALATVYRHIKLLQTHSAQLSSLGL